MKTPDYGELITRAASGDAWALSTIAGWLPNPDPVLKKLGRSIQVYRDLKSDSRVKSCIQSRKLGVLSSELEIVPNGDSRAAKNAASFARAQIFNLKLQRVISEILDAVLFGYSPIEVVWQKGANGEFVLADLIGKPQEWFAFDKDNKPVFLKAGHEPQVVPDMKLLIPTFEASYVNPYGEGILSSCFWPVTFKRGGLKFWVQFIEKFGTPFIKGTVPKGTPDEEKRKFAQSLYDMVQDAVVVLEEGENAEPLEGDKTASSALYKDLMLFCNNEISTAILGQTLTTDVGEHGSYAAVEGHMEVRADLVESDKKLVCETLNEALKWISKLNNSVELAPYSRFYEKEKVHLERAQRDEILARTGVQFTSEYFMRAYNLTERDIVQSSAKGETPVAFSEKRTKEIEKILDILES